MSSTADQNTHASPSNPASRASQDSHADSGSPANHASQDNHASPGSAANHADPSSPADQTPASPIGQLDGQSTASPIGRRSHTTASPDLAPEASAPPTPVDVLTVGETMGALRAGGAIRLGAPMTLSPAGAESTVAIGLARLGHRAGWVGRVGADEVGELIVRTLRAEAVDLAHVRVDPDGRPTGLMTREHRVGGIVRVDYHRAGSAGSALRAVDVLDALEVAPRVLHLTGVTPALSASAAEAVLAAALRAHDLGVVISFDVNYRARLWSPERARAVLLPLAELAEVLIASSDELHLVAPEPAAPEAEAVAAVLARGTHEVVLTRGGEGASVTTADGTVSVPARQVPVVDVVGAGDAFVAGYLSGLLDDLPPGQCLQRATATGAFAVATEGDWEGLPTRADLALLDQPAGTTIR